MLGPNWWIIVAPIAWGLIMGSLTSPWRGPRPWDQNRQAGYAQSIHSVNSMPRPHR